jgi:hypothetical protein
MFSGISPEFRNAQQSAIVLKQILETLLVNELGQYVLSNKT